MARCKVKPNVWDQGRMSKITRATQALEKASVAFTLHTYAYDPDADSIGPAGRCWARRRAAARPENADGGSGRQAGLRDRPVRPRSQHEETRSRIPGQEREDHPPV